MVFSSMTFLCVFLPVVLILYHVIPGIPAKNIFLIIASLLFYAYGEGFTVLLMIACALINWSFALVIERASSSRIKKSAVALAFVVSLLILGYYKYAGMAVETINTLFRASFSVPRITLPIGISFFTFQALGYTADVYRGRVRPQKNFFKVLLYICFFPQLVAGPIVKYRDVAAAIDNRTVTAQGTASGLRRFIFGLAKKVLIANTLAGCADSIYALDPSLLSLPAAWLGALTYMLQIYFDFSGYSDMAIGLGRMFGFSFQENFNYPYAALSMLDFWRRWHISLTDWFRENLYFPLGGNRKGKVRTWINRFIVFFCTGLWHGANWTFVLWGLYHGAFTVLETAAKAGKAASFLRNPKLRILHRIYVWLIVMIGFVLFRADSVEQAGIMIGHMFVPAAMTAERLTALYRKLDRQTITALVLGVIFSFPLVRALHQRSLPRKGAEKILTGLSYAASFALLFLCMMSLSGGAYNPFIYFRF